MRVLLLLLVLPFSIEISVAQEGAAKKDTTKIYRDIETYSKKSKFRTFIYKLIFKPIEPSAKKSSKKNKQYKKLINKPYSAFEGKIIRHINILTLDPFGYSINDTTSNTKELLPRAANRLHIRSQKITIRNLLLIHRNDEFDSLLVKESERLVRSRPFVKEVLFTVTSTGKNSDSVDISIREIDNWSMIPEIAISTTRMTVNVLDRNFFGLGHEFKPGFTWYQSTGNNALTLKYFIPNIRNTFINSTFLLDRDQYGNYNRGISVDRPFFSPFAKWAAGMSFIQNFRRDTLKVNDTLNEVSRIRLNTQDYWGGNAIQIFKGNSEESRTTNLITTLRYLRIRYLEKPSQDSNSTNQYENSDFYMTGIGVSTRKYVQDKFIFNYGITEDVPIGKVYGITAGYQARKSGGRVYLGARVSFGEYYKWGYLSTNLEYGTFYRSSNREEGVISAGFNYFTGLIETGLWKFRLFAKPQFTFGLNRLATDSITLRNNSGLEGFNSYALSGTDRMILSFQAQSYAPWNLIGFHFGPYLIYSMGVLGDETTGFRNSKVYSQIGLGVLIRNENFIINTFQFSVSFYPQIPGNGDNIFKFNSFRTTDFGFRDFEIGKPAALIFQ